MVEFKQNKDEFLKNFNQSLKEIFSCGDFLIQPVDLAGNFYGFIVAFHFDSVSFLQRTARYLALGLRNIQLENRQRRPEVDSQLEQEIDPTQFPLVLSREVSRSRHLKSPLSLILCYLSMNQSKGDETGILNLIKTQLRSYDCVSRLDEHRWAFILPHCLFGDAAIKAEKIRRGTSDSWFKDQKYNPSFMFWCQ